MKNTKSILVGTLVSGMMMFFLGWLIYGIALSSFMSANCENGNQRPMGEMVWWAMILSNFTSGLLLSITLNMKDNLTMSIGLKIGLTLGFLIALAFDLSMYSMTTTYSNLAVIIVDSIAYSIMFGVSGMVIAPIMNKLGK